MKLKTVGSAPNLVDLCALIQSRWSWSNPCAILVKPNEWQVQCNGKPIEGVRIIKKGQRYVFQLLHVVEA